MRNALALALALAAFGTSCSYRNEDINRVVNPYWSKDYFNKDNAWYYRTTVVDAPPESNWISIADGDWLMLEKLRWEITQDYLIGWRDYSLVPGSDLDQYPGSDDVFQGEPIAQFKITDHFDIKREFDPGTGEESNVISENRDRLWYDRAYIRVDWSVNLIDTYKWHIMLTQVFDTVEQPSNDPAEPKRWRFEPDYFEVTTRTRVVPDIFQYFSFYGTPWYGGDPSGQIVDMRHSFMKVPKSDYEALPMPPVVTLEDADGNEVRDAKGFAVQVPINDRFGYFGTLGRNTFDQNRGMVTAGQINNASRFNIWKHHRDADGSIIPTDQRDTKPIIYYGNVDMPRAYVNGSKRVAAEWNKVFRDTVFRAQPTRYTGTPDADTGIPSDVPDMFLFRENDCNVANVKNVLHGLPTEIQSKVTKAAVRAGYAQRSDFDGTIASVEKRIDHANDKNTDYTEFPLTQRVAEEAQAAADLERICSALEYYTGGDATLGIDAPSNITPFKYERLGDTRYSMMDMIPGVFQAGWLGLGPPYSDPETGETISGTANVSAAGLDRYARYANEWIEVMNGQVDATDFVYGYNIARYMAQKLVKTNGLETWKPTQDAKDRMHQEFAALKQSAQNGDMRQAMGEMPNGFVEERMQKIMGTPLEDKLISPEDIMAFGGVAPDMAAQADMDDSLRNAVSPVREGNIRPLKRIEDVRRMMRMGQRAMDPPEMIDSLAIGHALALRDLPYRERLDKLREDIYVAVMLHEVGHNTGLFHNMAGSADALNFGKSFWDEQKLNPDIDLAVDSLSGATSAKDLDTLQQLQNCQELIAQLQVDDGGDGLQDPGEIVPEAANMTTQECLRQTEGMYSSIMDYHANWSADHNGLGPYDYAANKFAYGGLLEVFPTANLRDRGADTRSIKRKIFLDGWQTIPTEILTNEDAINQREYVKMEWNTSSTRQAPLPNEVPYKFGWGASFTPDEKPFDFGADFQTNAKVTLSRYFDNFFFTHFARDHLSDFDAGINRALNSDDDAMYDFTEKMQWFFFFEATDPDFPGSWAEQDLLGTTITGLNFLGQVIGHPGSGLHVSVRNEDIFGLLDKDTSERNGNPSGIMLPWGNFGECTARQLAETADVNGDARDDGVFVRPKAGFDATIVPISEGRPFFLGLTDDYEDWYLKYVGTYWTKLDALFFLGMPYAWFPRTEGQSDPRIFNISWYRLFPKQVGKIFHNLITENFQDLGPIVRSSGDPDLLGSFEPRVMLNADLTEPDYSAAGIQKVMPSISYNHEEYAILYANALLATPFDDTQDLPRSMNLALQGAGDDMSAFDNADPADVIEFVHPITGLTLRGLKVGDNPIAYDLLKRLNRMKERFLELDGCLNDYEDADPATDSHFTDQYCFCIDYYTDAVGGDCTIETTEPVDTGGCTGFDLRNRRESARESMDDLADYANDVRTFNHYFQ